MTSSVLSAAKTLGNMTEWSLSNLELNKLLFLSQMVRLGETNGQHKLISNVFEAWDYGPVSPRLYHKAKTFGSKSVGNIFHQYDGLTDEDDIAAIAKVIDLTKDKKPGELVAITHWDGGAWYKNYEPGKMGVVIPDAHILEEYNKRAGR